MPSLADPQQAFGTGVPDLHEAVKRHPGLMVQEDISEE